MVGAEFWANPDAAAATLPPGVDPDPATPGHALLMFVDWQFTAGNDEILFPDTSGEEMHVLSPARVGLGFRFSMAYTVTDFKVLEDLTRDR